MLIFTAYMYAGMFSVASITIVSEQLGFQLFHNFQTLDNPWNKFVCIYVVKEELHEDPGYVPFKNKTNTKVVPKSETNMIIGPTYCIDVLSVPGHQWFIENSM